MKVSVVLPTYCEAGNILDLIAAIKTAIPSDWESEVLVVDDNSPDGTYQKVVAQYQDDSTVRAICRTENRGLGNSIRTGVENATGDYLLVMDTDFTHRPEEIPLMLHVVTKVDLVSGSRFCPGGSMGSVRHYLASFLFNIVLRVILRTQIQDNLSGFWAAKTQKVRSLPLSDIFNGYGDYYFRLLHYAQKSGMRLVELPTNYALRKFGQSKSNFPKLLFRYSYQALALVWHSRTEN